MYSFTDWRHWDLCEAPVRCAIHGFTLTWPTETSESKEAAYLVKENHNSVQNLSARASHTPQSQPKPSLTDRDDLSEAAAAAVLCVRRLTAGDPRTCLWNTRYDSSAARSRRTLRLNANASHEQILFHVEHNSHTQPNTTHPKPVQRTPCRSDLERSRTTVFADVSFSTCFWTGC